jgi:hypothetical protein
VLRATLLLALSAAVPDASYRAALDPLYNGAPERSLVLLSALQSEGPEDPLPSYLRALVLCWQIEQRGRRDAALEAAFHAEVDRALLLSQARLQADAQDARALFARAAAHGVRSRFHLYRHERGPAARAAVRMREDLQAAARLRPDSAEVRFGLGLYDYFADVLPRFFKLVRFFLGIPGGDRERGLRALEASREAVLHDVEARVQLFEIYAFWEDQPDRALAEIAFLRARYPHWPLWGLKLAEHLRERLGAYARSAAVAREMLEAGAQGEANYQGAAAAMAQLALGEALLLDLRLTEAEEAIARVPAEVEGAPWLADRRRLQLARCLALQGRGERAAREFAAAASAADPLIRRAARAALAEPLPEKAVEAHRLLAEARRRQEVHDQGGAVAAARRALALRPGLAEAAFLVADFEVREGEVGRARRLVTVLAGGDLEPPWLQAAVRLLRGHLFDLQGQRARARAEYEAVRREPYARPELQERAAAALLRPFARARP